MAAAAIEAFGGIDFLVNNAALFGGMKTESMLQVDWDYYKKFMDINLDGALLCARACYGSMGQRGGGAIVNQSSTAAWMGVGYYGLAKYAINGLTHCLTRELGPMNIRVNAIAPGPTDTQALQSQVPEEYKHSLVASIPISRLGQPKDMADACLWLLSDAASWVNGQLLAVDGGQIIRG
jgi:3-oxoacyl-[acyl-carrier protein] reductase